MNRIGQLFMCAVLGAANVCFLAGCINPKAAKLDSSRVARQALSNAVTVVIHPRVDLEEPLINQVAGERCPNCGNFHGESLSSFVKLQSGIQTTGFLLGADRVICPDQLFPLENIASISVTAGGRTVAASPVSRFADQCAMLLKLEAPLTDGVPADIGKDVGQPVCAVSVTRQSRDPVSLQAIPKPLQASQVYGQGGNAWSLVDVPSVLFDAQSRICGYAFNAQRQTGTPANPDQWAAYSLPELARLTDASAAACAQSVLPVTLNFRSPRMSRGANDMFGRHRFRGGNDEDGNETATELNTVGVLVSGTRLFIRTNTDKEKFRRLEQITVHFPEGPETATFVCALSAYRGIVAEIRRPRTERVLKQGKVMKGARSDELVFVCRPDVSGPGRLRIRTVPVRVQEMSCGWRDLVTTDLPIENAPNLFVMTSSGECIWWKASINTEDDSIGEGSNGWRGSESDSPFLTAATLAALAEPPAQDIDSSVHPVPPEEEDRLGWLGLDLQAITPELAETKKVMAETGGGKFGAIVTRVFPGSPAAQAGVADGWILLSITPESRTLPMKVEFSEDEVPYRSEFPWERLDEVPAEYFDRLPTPWPSTANAFVKGLTQIGIGKKLTASFLADGKPVAKPMTIALAPPSYESAPSFKWKAGGISVCDLTQDVRDYLNLGADAPGVVVCRAESGGKAVTAGVRPFELITRFNGKPVQSAKAFEALVAGATEIRLDVRRMTRDRVVSFTVDAAK